MRDVPFKSKTLTDYLFDFTKGVNNGIGYTLLPKDQLARASNTTVRGSFVGPRPRFRKISLTAPGYSGGALVATMQSGRYQGGCFYRPDVGTDSLLASISGSLYRFEITGSTATVSDVSIPGDLNGANEPQAWLWQAEKWAIVTDGTTKNPIFYDGTSSRRSGWSAPVEGQAATVGLYTIPAVGTTADMDFSNVLNLSVGDIVTVWKWGTAQVTAIAGTTVTLLNLTLSPVGTVFTAPADPAQNLSWRHTFEELPPGRMGAYGLGRVWMTLTDGKQFLASDIVGGSSGTLAENYRDAVLRVTENNYLFGGGNFTVPGSYGDIRAMVFSETLDSSLGQGPLQVYTPKTVFSCNAPVDRTTWQDITNPILTESAKGGGGLSQWSTINVNSDVLSRDVIGIRSLILTRREFNTWGNVPISREVASQLSRDSESLLGYTSAVDFDNRFLLTTEGAVVENRGVTWSRIVVINNDTVSTIQGKAPSVYDTLYWEGLNIFQLIRAEIASVDRCFAFTLNNNTGLIELWEILKSADFAVYDDVDTRPVWSIDSPCIDFGQKDPRSRFRLRLGQASIEVSELRGKVSFRAYFRPDFWPCWVPWAAWEECASDNDTEGTSPSFRPRMGLPEPDPGWCDETTNRPLREGYFYQVRLEVTGDCKIQSWKLTADTVPEPNMPPPSCNAICP